MSKAEVLAKLVAVGVPIGLQSICDTVFNNIDEQDSCWEGIQTHLNELKDEGSVIFVSATSGNLEKWGAV